MKSKILKTILEETPPEITEKVDLKSELILWQSTAKGQIQLLQMIENKIKMEDLEDEFYEELIQIQFSLKTFNTQPQ